MTKLWEAFKAKNTPTGVQHSPVIAPAVSALLEPINPVIPSGDILQSPLLHDSDGISLNLNTTSKTANPWYKDGSTMSGYAGLAGSLLQAAALPGQMKLAKTQEKMLSANLNQFNKDNAFRDSAKANINRVT